MIKKIFRKISQIFNIVLACVFKNKSAFLRIIKYEVENYLTDCCNAGTRQIEDLHNLLFHINSYLEIPETTRALMFPMFSKKLKKATKKDGKIFLSEEAILFPDKYVNYLEEIERQRSVERLYILELLKRFPFESVI